MQGTGGAGSGGDSTGGKDGATGGKGGSTGGNDASSGGHATGGGSAGGSTGGLGGMGGMGGSLGEACTAPFEVGDCDAAFGVYWHNPATGRCEAKTWGGCGGNANRYETELDCEIACDARPPISCEVDGVEYADGATVPDPFSCNTCRCDNGKLEACTKIHCPEDCDEGTVQGTECAECGPTDECLSVRTRCLTTCEDHDDCAGRFCDEGVCRNVCG